MTENPETDNQPNPQSTLRHEKVITPLDTSIQPSVAPTEPSPQAIDTNPVQPSMQTQSVPMTPNIQPTIQPQNQDSVPERNPTQVPQQNLELVSNPSYWTGKLIKIAPAGIAGAFVGLSLSGYIPHIGNFAYRIFNRGYDGLDFSELTHFFFYQHTFFPLLLFTAVYAGTLHYLLKSQRAAGQAVVAMLSIGLYRAISSTSQTLSARNSYVIASAIIGAAIFMAVYYLAERVWAWQVSRLVIIAPILTLAFIAVFAYGTHQEHQVAQRSIQTEQQDAENNAQQQDQKTKQRASNQHGTQSNSSVNLSVYSPSSTPGLSLTKSELLGANSSNPVVVFEYNQTGSSDLSNATIHEFNRPQDFNPPHCGYEQPGGSIDSTSCTPIGQTNSGKTIYYDVGWGYTYWGDFGSTIISVSGFNQAEASNAIHVFSGMQATTIKALKLQ